jgi:SAM-dependent methyltransferase
MGAATPGDPFAQFKAMQRQGWAHFAPLQAVTTVAAAHLVKFAKIRAGQDVLDVGCGTGVVSVTATRRGAKVTGIDLTPELLVHARENAAIAGVHVEWREGDAENLPFADNSFHAVVSQFGHMFAPRPDVAIAEMLRVLKPGGTIAFSTWPPELLVGRTFRVSAKYGPAPPPGVVAPVLWGDPNVVRERLGNAVTSIEFDCGRIVVPTLSPQHFRSLIEKTAGPMIKLVETLGAADPAKLAAFRAEFDAAVAEYYEDNTVRQDFLMTRAIKS